MFSFEWPWFALLLLLPVAIILWERRSESVRPLEAADEVRLVHPGTGQLRTAFGLQINPVAGSSVLSTLLLGLLWAALVAALMRPQWLESSTEVVNRGHDLMLAVDTSRSMEALDFTVEGQRVNRLSVIKGVVGRFIEQRHGDRIGLLLFGDEAYVLAPLTLDGAAVRSMLDDAMPRMAGSATAIGDAIGLAVKKLRERPEGSRVLVLVTDGENTAGSLPPLEAARLADHYDVRIYTIGVGSKGKVPFMDKGVMTYQDMQIDEDLLRQVAAMTGGAYFRATDTQALEEIYRRIDALEKTEAETRTLMIPHPLYRWPLALALLSLVLIAAKLLWGRRALGVARGG